MPTPSDIGWMDVIEKLWPAIASIGALAVTVWNLMKTRVVKDDERDRQFAATKDLGTAIAGLIPRIAALEAKVDNGDDRCEQHADQIKELRQDFKDLGVKVNTNTGWIERFRGRINIG